MTEYDEILSNTNGYESDSSEPDTDEELKEAFAAGLLKPGLNYMGEAPEKKVAKNNVAALKQKLAELQRNLPWVRLTAVTRTVLFLLIVFLPSDRVSGSREYTGTLGS